MLAGDALPIQSGQRRSLLRVTSEIMTDGHRLVLTPTVPIAAREIGLALEADQYFAGPPGRADLTSGRDAILLQLAQANPRTRS